MIFNSNDLEVAPPHNTGVRKPILGGLPVNAQRIYVEQQDAYLARQIEADKYQTFVAMPFRDQFSYKSDDVFDKIITKAVELANQKSVLPKKFDTPLRADKIAPNATEITDDIVEGILNSHFFLADFTMANHGVLVEAGIALAFKHTKCLIFLIQGNPSDVHFDIKDNRFLLYDKSGAIPQIADALIAGADFFETTIGDQIKAVREKLSPQSVYLLNFYGRVRLQQPGSSLHFGQVQNDGNLGSSEAIRRLVFDAAIQELLSKKLIYLDYSVADDGINPDRFGLHATQLGKVFIRKTWSRSLGNVQ